MTAEERYARLLTGGTTSVLMTDGYKPAMAQAGFPLRPETFYMACRKGGPYFIPFDFAAVVQAIFGTTPRYVPETEDEYLTKVGYGLTPAMREAWVNGQVEAWAPPVGSWIGDKEPMLTVTGPSFLVSWLEPLAIMFRFAAQVATAAKRGETEFRCTCHAEAEIVRLVLDQIGLGQRPNLIEVNAGAFKAGVSRNVEAVKAALKGEVHRAFEVGMRAASCMEMHGLALQVCNEHGITKTSNIFLAKWFGMTPVGTTGHEHQQRWGSDEDGFRAVRDMRPQPPSYLFDTYDALGIGIPAAVRVMREDLSRKCFVRFDSGDQTEQLRRFLIAHGHFGVDPGFIFEDGYTAERTEDNEDICCRDVTDRGFGIEDAIRLYGYGGYFVNPQGVVQFRRDDASAVFKLAMTGSRPTRKSCESCPDKASVPGKPVALRDNDGLGMGRIGQLGEDVPGWHVVTPDDPVPLGPPTWTPETQRLMALCDKVTR